MEGWQKSCEEVRQIGQLRICGWNRMGPAALRKETALSHREVNKVLGKEKGPGTQSKVRISES